MKVSEMPFAVLADRRWHYIGGWAIRYNPEAKTFPFTAWTGSGTRRVGVKASSLTELKHKIRQRGVKNAP